MAYKSSPRPTFDRPTHIPYAGVTRYLWGDDVSGKVDDWIYVSSAKIHELVFGLAPGGVVTTATKVLSGGSLDEQQVLAYDLAHAAAAVETARSLLDYGAKGDVEAAHRRAPSSPTPSHDLAARLLGREADVGRRARRPRRRPRLRARPTATPAFLAALAGEDGPRHLDDDFELVQDTFRRFADEKLAPDRRAHPPPQRRHPRGRSSAGLAEMGALRPVDPRGVRRLRRAAASPSTSAWSSPPRSCRRGSLGAGGSLITRPEILTRALRRRAAPRSRSSEWLPKLATGRGHERGRRHRARLRLRRRRHQGHRHARPTAAGSINGVKTWCTFGARADVLMLLARTDPDRSQDPPGPVAVHRARSRGATATASSSTRTAAASMEGRPIDTIGYRGMHSYEIAFDDWFVADANLDRRRGRARARASTYQMAGFENGRLQTAARAVGVMQAAYEAARAVRRRPHRVRPARSPTTSSPR